jgi:hypothetical protein
MKLKNWPTSPMNGIWVVRGVRDEPPRVCRRLFGLSHAASLRSSSKA